MKPKEWFKNSGAKALIDQARQQSGKVRGMGLRIEWHVTEAEAAEAIQGLLRGARIEGITVLHTPAK